VRDAHLICREGARLVRTDDVRAAQGFNARKVPNNSILLRHLLRSQCQTRGNNSSQSFRNRGDGQSDSNLKVIDGTLQRAMVIGVPEMAEVYEPDQDANNSDDLCEHIAEVVEFTFQRRLLRNLRRDGLVDVANGSPLTCVYDNGFRISIHNSCSL
jgi:hypothetical protein